MCGLVAIFTNRGDLESRSVVMKEMLDTIAHRGPDDEGMHKVHDQALFGHRRLAVIDLEHGAQPMCSNDGRYTLVYNGEIYNSSELREQLGEDGVYLTTFSDTEVLLRLLIQKGPKFYLYNSKYLSA